MEANKTLREKATWELHKNAMRYIEQILETTALQLLNSPLKNHPSKINKTCRTLLEKKGRTHK